jgi:hypothetical protein
VHCVLWYFSSSLLPSVAVFPWLLHTALDVLLSHRFSPRLEASTRTVSRFSPLERPKTVLGEKLWSKRCVRRVPTGAAAPPRSDRIFSGVSGYGSEGCQPSVDVEGGVRKEKRAEGRERAREVEKERDLETD